MSHDLLKSQWPRLRREVRAMWTRLGDDDIEIIAGDEEILIGTLQERYGRSREELEREVDSWLAKRRQEEPQRDEPQRDEPQRDEPQRDEPQRDEPQPKRGERRHGSFRIIAVVLAFWPGLAPAPAARGEHVAEAREIQTALELSAAAEDADRAAVRALLEREDVRRLAGSAGLDLARATAAAATLEGPELEQMAARARAIEEELAGGHTVVITTTTLVLAMLIALIILV